jgi:hypothetical protein
VYVRSDGAIAFARPLAYHAPTLAKMEAFFRGRGQPVTDAAKRMALFPADSAVVEVPRLWVPLVVCENVYVLPGVPQLFTAMVQALPGRLGHHGTIHRILLYTPDVEGPPTRSSLSLSLSLLLYMRVSLLHPLGGPSRVVRGLVSQHCVGAGACGASVCVGQHW